MPVVKIPDDLIIRIKSRKRPHQAIAGVIQELLDLADKVEGKTTDPKTLAISQVIGEALKE